MAGGTGFVSPSVQAEALTSDQSSDQQSDKSADGADTTDAGQQSGGTSSVVRLPPKQVMYPSLPMSSRNAQKVVFVVF